MISIKKNSGSPFKQWKKGLELAKGELIWIAESDDYADANFLQTAINSLSNCQSAILFSSASFIVDESDNTRENPLTISLSSGCYNGAEIIRQFLVDRNRIVNASACVFKKEEALKHIEQIIDFKMVGDWLFWVALLSKGMFAYSDKKLNYFRDTSFSTRQHYNWQKKITRLTEELKVLEFLFKNKIIREELLNKRLETIKNRLCWSFPSIFSAFKLKEDDLTYEGFSIAKKEILRHCFELKIRSIKNKIFGKTNR